MISGVFSVGCKQPQSDRDGALSVRQSLHSAGQSRELTRTGGGGVPHCAQRSQYEHFCISSLVISV